MLSNGIFVPLVVQANTRFNLERSVNEWGLTVQNSLHIDDPTFKCEGAVLVLRDDQLSVASSAAKELGVSMADAKLV